MSARPMSAGDEDPLPGQAVDPDAGRQREQQERQEVDGHEQADLARRRPEQDRRDERDRDLGDLGAEQGDRRGGPEPREIRLSEEGSASGDGGFAHG
jgi:hypothetical protein